MTNPATLGYLQRPYLNDPYMSGFAQQSLGMQVTMVIASSTQNASQVKALVNGVKPVASQVKASTSGSKANASQTKLAVTTANDRGSQVKLQVMNAKAVGSQAKMQIAVSKALGLQTKAVAAGQKPTGSQVKLQDAGLYAEAMQTKLVTSAIKTLGFQVKGQSTSGQPTAFQIKGVVVGYRANYAMQVKTAPGTYAIIDSQIKRGNFAFWDINGYLVAPYLTGPYLAGYLAAQGGTQTMQVITPKGYVDLQTYQIIGTKTPLASQVRVVIPKTVPTGHQAHLVLSKARAVGTQVKGFLSKASSFGFQVYPYVNVKLPIGFQVTGVEGKIVGFQVTVVLYNTTNLRILSNFPSRGNGSNWTASSTAPGDFNANNLNTDIVEQQWRSAQGSTVGITLDSDTGVSSVFVDTIAILNHNLTSGAQITLEGSAFADQHLVGISIPLSVTPSNIIWISPSLPTSGFRYWRFVINDPTNTAGQIRIGTIVFGSSMIFENDNITYSVKKSRVHFADKIPTEGFTDVMNDRALKTQIDINFENLSWSSGNFQALDLIFQTVRTSLKALWIPDPQVPTRFGVFGKLPTVPSEQHNNLGPEADYVSLTVTIDESI